MELYVCTGWCFSSEETLPLLECLRIYFQNHGVFRKFTRGAILVLVAVLNRSSLDTRFLYDVISTAEDMKDDFEL